jgi:acetyltransferase
MSEIATAPLLSVDGPEAANGDLAAFFSPRSVAVIGATDKLASVGRAVMENLRGFAGTVYPVNFHHATVLGQLAFAHLAAVPELVDLAVIVTPACAVPGVVRECVAAGVKAAVILSAGFREEGEAGVRLERAVLAEARRGNLRLIGPNCLGVMIPAAGLNATFAATIARPGGVAFLSQSGALCTALLDWSLGEQIGFSAMVSVGSMLDVDWGDLIRHFGRDPSTRCLALYMESVGDARSFLVAAREVAATKPIVVLKVGRTAAAARAAASHTGSLTGSDEVLDAAFRRAGVLRAETVEDLFDLAGVLARQPRPRGPRLAIVTNAGGPAALAADRLVLGGGRLAQFSPSTLAALGAVVHAHGSRSNPVDVLGDSDPACFGRAMELVARDPGTDGVLAILTPQAMTDALATAREVCAVAAKIGDKPVLASWMGGPAVAPGVELLKTASIPTFGFPDRATQAFATLWHHRAGLAASVGAAVDADPAGGEVNQYPLTREIIAAACGRRRTILTEHESKQILAEYGIPTAATALAATPDEAVDHAVRLGFPVALKVHSETVTHKKAVGGVCLDVRDPDGVRQAWHDIKLAVELAAGPAAFLGLTVQPMLALNGLELILGSSTDPQFGPVLLFGAGGSLVEVLQDRALGLPPLDAGHARQLMAQTKIYRAIPGVTGGPPSELTGLEDALVRFSRLVVGQPRIKEIDLNPLLVTAGQVIALDARVILHDSNVPDDQLPSPALSARWVHRTLA